MAFESSLWFSISKKYRETFAVLGINSVSKFCKLNLLIPHRVLCLKIRTYCDLDSSTSPPICSCRSSGIQGKFSFEIESFEPKIVLKKAITLRVFRSEEHTSELQ